MYQLLMIALFMGGAFLIQHLFGFFQIKHFTNEYVKLRKLGKVAIGRRPGKIRSGTIVMFAINNGGKIIQAKKIQGVTIFSRVKDLKGFEGKFLKKLTQDDMSHCNKLLQEAIKDAIKTYEIVSNGGVIEDKPSPLRSLMLRAERLLPSRK